MPASCFRAIPGQHASVTRGDALRILENHSDFQSGQLTRIRRQRRAEYRKAVELAAQKQTAQAFAELEHMGAVMESARTTNFTPPAPSRI